MLKRILQIFLVLCTATIMLGASDSGSRFDKLGHKLMCTCSCGEILLECNHMGCPDSPNLIAKLRTQVASGASDSSILQAFAAEFGPIVLAAPIRGGFDLVAWIMPFAVLAIGLVAIIWLLRHWQDRHQQAAAAVPAGGLSAREPAGQVRDRIRRETTFEP